MVTVDQGEVSMATITTMSTATPNERADLSDCLEELSNRSRTHESRCLLLVAAGFRLGVSEYIANVLDREIEKIISCAKNSTPWDEEE